MPLQLTVTRPTMSYSTLRIDIRPHREPLSELDPADRHVWLAEFMVNDTPLSDQLGVSRASLAFFSCALDSTDSQGLRHYRLTLLGEVPAHNQMGSGRVVLYACHCGVDYCGVISARIVEAAGVTRWLDVGFEDDEGFHLDQPHIRELTFDTAAYRDALDKFFGPASSE